VDDRLICNESLMKCMYIPATIILSLGIMVLAYCLHKGGSDFKIIMIDQQDYEKEFNDEDEEYN